MAWWRSGLASLWAPFAEEIFDRLFLLSLIAWAGMRLFRAREEGRGRTIALWTANLATALSFGWYHTHDPHPSICRVKSEAARGLAPPATAATGLGATTLEDRPCGKASRSSS